MKRLAMLLLLVVVFGTGVYVGRLDRSDVKALVGGLFLDGNTLPLGAAMPAFDLPGVDDRNHTQAEFSSAELLAVVFTTNHCPTAQAYEQRIQELADSYRPEQLALVAISPNDAGAVRLDELGFSEYGDSLEEMKLRAAERSFTFPYLYDGERQQVSRSFGAMATPHIFIFDRERKLRYKGRIDDNENPRKVRSHDARNAIEALLAGKPVEVAENRVFGCSVKWAEKRDQVAEKVARWAQEKVELQAVDSAQPLDFSVRGGWRLLNIWATWCAPCKTEFPDLVDTYRMYRGRRVEFVTLSLDQPDNGDAALVFLREQQASMRNYHFTGTDRDALGDALGVGWQGAVPFTALISPSGQVVYRQHGPFDKVALRKAIVENLGRYYF